MKTDRRGSSVIVAQQTLSHYYYYYIVIRQTFIVSFENRYFQIHNLF